MEEKSIWIYCVSSTISGYIYFKTERTLLIAFNNGSVYEYSDVPKEIYDGLCQADSKGKYHAIFIKYQFKYKKIKDKQ